MAPVLSVVECALRLRRTYYRLALLKNPLFTGERSSAGSAPPFEPSSTASRERSSAGSAPPFHPLLLSFQKNVLSYDRASSSRCRWYYGIKPQRSFFYCRDDAPPPNDGGVFLVEDHRTCVPGSRGKPDCPTPTGRFRPGFRLVVTRGPRGRSVAGCCFLSAVPPVA